MERKEHFKKLSEFFNVLSEGSVAVKADDHIFHFIAQPESTNCDVKAFKKGARSVEEIGKKLPLHEYIGIINELIRDTHGKLTISKL